jgi:hypothetical protein
MKREDNIKAWMEQGMPDDYESLERFGITVKDIKRLEKRVMKAVANKKLEDPTKMVFAEHRTLQ